MMDPMPHFLTFGKNCTHRFKDTDLFGRIFTKILENCMKYKLVDTEQIFTDSTHVKACANNKGIAWIPIYAIYRKCPDGNESWAYFCVYELEKIVQDSVSKRAESVNDSYYLAKIKREIIFGRKVVLEVSSSTNFVYSLSGP